ncbi:non-ribosomal peptide synthetase [Azotobacter vinelandii DJ]|uniref:non-ribosomal peptide synthetase n=1 Tax=Azotobacter vinelandii TaxID=354 RepID=UPI0030CB1818
MDRTTAERIAKRFISLPLEQRRQILDKMIETGQSFRLLPIVPIRHEIGRLPLSYAQQRLLFLWQLEPDNSFYNVPMAVRLHGRLDEQALHRALTLLVQRHESLRTRFVSADGEFHQEILEDSLVALEIVSVAGQDETSLKARIRDEFAQPFDLLNGPMLRVKLLRLSDTDQVLTLCLHHIVSDGWSGELMVKEFVQLYEGLLEERTVELPELPIQYADYAIWQRAWLEAGEGERQLAYWKAQLGEEQPVLELPLDRERPASPSYRGALVQVEIPKGLALELRILARKGGHTLFMLVLAAVAVVLSRYSGQSDIRIGAPNAGRNRKELEGLIGFFINTQVLRVQVDERATFAEMIDQVKDVVAGAQSHQDLPFEQLVDALVPERNLSHNPLFQFKLNQNVAGEARKRKQLGGLEVEDFPFDDGSAHFDLALDFTDTPTGIDASFTYATDLFDSATIERIAASLRRTLEALVRIPHARLLECPESTALSQEQDNRVFPHADMLSLWQHGLQLGGEGAALRCGEQTLGYMDLERASNRLARHLQALGVGSGTTVALCQERSAGWVTAVLAVLKAGGLYLPLDSQQPADRLQQLLDDSRAALLIHDRHDGRFTDLPGLDVLAYDPTLWSGYSDEPLSTCIVPEQPAYVIYTSGSTGQPKGVVISHRALANYVQAALDRLQLPLGASMAMVSTVAADLGHTMLFGALASGRPLHLLPQELAFDPDGFAAYMATHRVGVLKLVPSHLQGLLQAARPADVLPEQALILGGEACPWALVERVEQLKPTCRIINHYGPTETTVGILTHEARQRSEGGRSVPVGRPLANGRAEILDAYLNPVPLQISGELYLGGQGLAQGYLGRPALTAERFVPAEQGERRYRTGDRARQGSDGLVEFVGRADDQVKIRGYRVEPGEITQILQNLEGVKEAVVQALPLESDASRLQLVAYCVAEAGVTVSVLQQGLQARLPDYMVPAHILLLERLPLTANGKLDRRALPKPGIVAQGYVAPVGEIEEKLAAIWTEVLKLERVGSHDNFFELGGDSILSLQIIARAKRQGIKLTPKQLFEKQTIGQLAQVAKRVEDKKQAATESAERVAGQMPLLPIQSRFFELDIPQRHHWNQSVLLRPNEPLDPECLKAALKVLVEHHDALRLRFTGHDGKWSARFQDREEAELLWQKDLLDISELEASGNEAQASLSLDQGPLLRAVLVNLPDNRQRLLLVIHHLVVDGVSWRVLLEDLQTTYRQAVQGQPLRLPARTSSLKHWAERLHAYASSEALQAEQEYWLRSLGEAAQELPRDNPDGDESGRQSRSASTRLDAELTQKLLRLAPAAYRTQVNDLLLAALARVLCLWSGQDSVLIQLEGHGREDLFEDIDLTRTVGWFTSLFPVRLTPRDDWGTSIKGIKEQLRSVPNKGIGYGILRYLGSEDIRQRLSLLPEARVTFNYLGQFDGSFAQDEGALFEPASESAGQARSEEAPLGNWLSINGQVYDGELHLEWTFSQDVYRPDGIERLARAYEQALADIVAYCADENNRSVTPSDVPLAGLSQEQLDALPLPAGEIEDIYPLSPMQQGMLFHSLLEHEAGHYINQMRVDVQGLDVERFRAAWQAVVDRHEVLRAGFVEVDGRPLQVIRRRMSMPCVELDWRGQPQLQDSLDTWAQADRQRGFDLEREPLLRLAVIRTGENRHHLIYTNHHILLDGWSGSQLQGEVLQAYTGKPIGHPGLRYRDYIAWLGRQDRAASEAFWREQLGALEEPTRLADSIRRADGRTGEGYGDHVQLLDSRQTAALSEFARAQRVTVNTLVQAAWLLLLQRYSGQATVCFGATVAGRPAELQGVEGQLGLFINTLPVIASPRSEQHVGEWLDQVQAQNLGLREHEHTPLYEIQRWAGLGGEALFDSLLVFENYPIAEALQQGAPKGLVFERIAVQEQTNYPLTLAIGLGETLTVRYGYDRGHFDAAGIERIAGHFARLLQGLASDARAAIGELPLLDPEEYQRIVRDWNRTEARYPSEHGVHQLIEEQVARTPEAVALVFGEREMSYGELNRKANRLAHRLRELGVGPDVLVGIAVERGFEMVVGLLAILKAGGAYVPLDPEYPGERLAYMIGDSGIGLLLTQRHLQDRLPPTGGVRNLLLEPDDDWLEDYPQENPANRTAPQNLAYVIYTSGSTGRPKGAGNTHTALINRLHWMQKAYRLDTTDTVLQKTPFSFDVSVWELFWPLLNGARLAIARPGEHRDPERLIDTIERHGVTTLHFVPSMLQAFISVEHIEGCRSIRRLVCSGEALPAELARKTLERMPTVGLFNLYGPTEAAIDVTHWTCDHVDPEGVPIGQPIDNLKTHILEESLHPVAPRCCGELYLGGVGLARGYHNRPGLTAERFVPDPFDSSEQGGGRLYRTGDLARYRADGVIEYQGRIDHQVKIRGFRIELGEIEARLQQHEAVREAVVIDIDGPGGRQLAAYLVPDDLAMLDGDERQTGLRGELKAYLGAALPDYMVPAHLVFLARLPLTPNGKLDRKALPRPDVSLLQRAYVAPASELEQRMAAIWAKVLKVERVGLTDNFFELGGHSLLATQVISRVRQSLGIELPLRALFEAQDLASFAGRVGQGQTSRAPALEKADRGQPLVASYAQQRQWFLWQLEPGSAAYHIPAALRLKGALDIEALRRSFEALIRRHESLRTIFRQDGERTIQVIPPSGSLWFEQEPLPADAAIGLDERIRARVEAEVQRLFDLERGPLLRVKLLRLDEDDHVLVLTLHHIVSDGWSSPLMVDELVHLYEGYSQGREVTLPELPVQYADYALWQRQWMETGERDRQLDYWTAQLGGEQPVLELPGDRPRPAVQTHAGARLAVELDGELARSLRELARREGVTLFMLLLASFQSLLHRYSGQDDIRVGVPIANRTRAETEGLIGFFVNTQVLKAEFELQTTFVELLRQVKRTALEAQAHQDLPFEQLVEALQPERSLSHSPLFQVMYNHQTAAKGAARTLPGLRVEGLAWENRTTHFDLTLDTYESANSLSASLTYATDLFDERTIERLARHWLNLLAGIVRQPERRIGELALLDPEEYRRIVQAWNRTEARYPSERGVHQLIEDQVARTPEAVALVFGEQEMSYGELNGRANRLAHRLIELGVGPDVLVGIAVERGFEMVVGLLAILKAGGAYVPLDPEYPRERLAYMIGDSGIDLLLTQEHLQDRLPSTDGVQNLLLEPGDDWLEGYGEENPASRTMPQNLAYVIYTSGSTGQPKGVTISHGAFSMHSQAVGQCYGLTVNDRLLQFASISFDAAAEQLFTPLANGAAVVLGDVRQWSAVRLAEEVERSGITALNVPPAYIDQISDALEEAHRHIDVRICILGGEAWKAGLLGKAVRAGQVFNAYGPTETVITPLVWQVESDEFVGYAPIGKPVGQRQAYLLDDSLNPEPQGNIAELYLGGEGLARGYLNRPSLTAERFVPDPFDDSEQGGGRLYRTGDLARYRADGVIEYLGRLDHQVKIRGFRIELGEIEARLQQHEAVREAVVIDVEGPGGRQLAAYLVPDDSAMLEGDERQTKLRRELKAHLGAALPDYMVPAHLVFLERLPLTPNGKLDRKALPRPDASLLQQAYVAPASELEQRIAAIWAEVLKVERVGLTDNFFELGGDSIISLQVVSRARQAGIRFTPKDLFQHQTVQGLATVTRLGDEGGVHVDQGPLSGETALLPIQQYFFEEAIPERHHWNQSLLLKPGRVLDGARLEQAVQALIDHHDALRLAFVEDPAGHWSARYRPASERQSVLWQAELRSAEELERLGNEAQRSLNLQEGPLLRGVLAELADGSQRLLLAIHHLVVDGVSWRILLEDLQTAYGQLEQGRPVSLPGKTSSTRAWVEHLQGYANSEAGQRELAHWREQLEDVAGELPCDNPAGGQQNRHAAHATTHLARDWTRRLLQEAPAAYRTQVNDLLLTALARVLTRWTGQAAALVQLEGHGREDLFDDVDLTRTVGWFTSVYPAKLCPSETLDGSIKAIKEQLRAIPNKGIGFGILRYLGDEPTRQYLAGLPVPRITFNYLGQFDGSFDRSEEHALLVPAGESAGAEQSPDAPLGNWLSINGQVYGGELRLTWTFSRERFAEATIQRLADAYARELEALVEHCGQAEHRGVTPSDVPLAGLSQEQLDTTLPVPAGEIEDIYPLSPMQQGMLFHSLLEHEAGHYINQMRVDVQGLDVERFRAAWQAVVDRHEVLRAGFVEVDGRPLQVIRRRMSMPCVELDWRGQPQLQDSLDTWAQADRQRGFDLEREPLLRLAVIRTGENRHHLIYTNHHILLDGWSGSQLQGEVLQAYTGKPIGHPGLRYRDYIAWLGRQDRAASEAFWREQLGALEEPTRLADSIRRADGRTGEGYGDHVQLLDSRQTAALSEFARTQRVTVNTLVQAAWLLLLQRYTGQTTVSFGATVAGRPAELQGVEGQLGLFINTLPVIASPRAEQRVVEWLGQVQAQNLGLREHEHTPLYEIQRWAGLGGEALFDSLLVFENYPIAEALQQGAPEGLVFDRVTTQEQTNYPLTLAIGLGETLTVRYGYDRGHFDAADIERIAGHFARLLQGLASDAQAAIGELPLLDPEEYQRIVHDWNRTEARYPSECCVHQLIEEQVARTPEAVALVFGEREMSYAELNRRANRLAHRLIELGVGPDVPVGIAVERGVEMVVGLLAILKAGGAYVPLDPEYPGERLAYMIGDSGIGLLLTQRHLQDRLPSADGAQSLFLEPDDDWLEGYGEENPANRTMPQNLAYVIYTSGSTGRPKGAAVRIGSFVNLLHWYRAACELTADDRVLLLSSYSFDLTQKNLYGVLCAGGQLHIAPAGYDPDSHRRQIGKHRLSVLNCAPSAFYPLLQGDRAELASLKHVLLGGEAIQPGELAEWLGSPQAANVSIHNTYGPTECTDVVIARATPGSTVPGLSALPIGRPLPGVSAYVLDGSAGPVALGQAGELHIGGDCVGEGYWHRPGLTAERFVPDPFDDSAQGGGRLYRTGDLARYRADGVIEYLGRIDHQVKIRGFRIELGEIEARLRQHGAVREAVVIDVEGAGGKQLAAYLVPDDPAMLEDDERQTGLRGELKAHLGAVLPDYMVPVHLVFLARLPLTPNGKLDRKALPQLDASLLQRTYVAPVSELEQRIAAIWAEVLKVERVGLSDNFFELGGHSLLATQVIARIREQLGIDMALRELFELPVLAEFSQGAQEKFGQIEPLQGELAKSLETLKRLTAEEIDELIS